MSEVQTSSGHLEKGRGRNIMYTHRYTIDNHAYKLLCLHVYHNHRADEYEYFKPVDRAFLFSSSSNKECV